MTQTVSGLTPTMEKALAWIRLHDGKIARYPGGFWGIVGPESFGTTTIEALVKRGHLKYTAWRGYTYKFPVEASLTGRVDVEPAA